MRRIMRAGIDAARLGMFRAEIAGRGFFLHHGFFLPGVLVILGLGGEGMHVDVPVRAIFRAQPAADAPILNDHFQ